MSLRIHIEVNGRVVGRAVIQNVSRLADISDYDVSWSEEPSDVSGLPERAGTASIEGHLRRQSVWALVEKVAAIAMGGPRNTALNFCSVLSKPAAAKALCFDGSAQMAAMILEWISATGLPKGHFRTNIGARQGEIRGAIFLPWSVRGDQVMRVDPGDWIVLDEKTNLTIHDHASFAQLYEVAL